MIDYFTNWYQIMEDSYKGGNIFLWAWSIGAQLLPFVIVIAGISALCYAGFRLWEERGL